MPERRFWHSRTHVAPRIWLWHLTTTHLFTARALPSNGSSISSKTPGARSTNDWPPYDIVWTGDDSYRISIAVAGFAQDDLDITFQSNLLMVTGKKQEVPADGCLHRGITGRPFEHRFELADHVRVTGPTSATVFRRSSLFVRSPRH